MTKTELYREVKNIGLRGCSAMNRDELESVLLDHIVNHTEREMNYMTYTLKDLKVWAVRDHGLRNVQKYTKKTKIYLIRRVIANMDQ